MPYEIRNESGDVLEVWKVLPRNWKHVSYLPGLSVAEREALGIFEVPLSLEETKTNKFAEIEAERRQRIAQGVSYTFPDASTGTVQLRDERDMANVQSIASAGQTLVMQGNTTTTLAFRDAENAVHALLGSEVVAMGMYVLNAVSAISQAAWAHKDAVALLATVTEVENYDFSTGWPG